MKRKILKYTTLVFIALFSITTVSRAQNTSNEKLSVREQKIVPIAAFTASGEISKLKIALNQGLDGGLTINEIKEVLVHIYAYSGFPRSLNGINAFMSVLDDRKAKGITDKSGREAGAVPSGFDKFAYGNKVRNTLVGADMSKPKGGYQVFVPAIDRFLVEHLFADIFFRDVLTHQERELVTISILAAMTGTEAQLKTHLKIAMNTGYSEAQLHDFIKVLNNNVGSDVAERAAAVLGELQGVANPLQSLKAVKVIKKTASVKGSSDNFTGNVTVESIFASERSNSYRGGVVNFKAGSRTAWHTHPYGQTLIVISGRGLVQSEGESVQKIMPGDVVWIPANERHWHGAAPDSDMSHTAISEPGNGSTVKWMEHVTDEQYSN
jgi:quercetin dioxygenase-like cupin family protein/alkylhydroperoxidase/carboxymuconolactone decarboxylase family protein YurZ